MANFRTLKRALYPEEFFLANEEVFVTVGTCSVLRGLTVHNQSRVLLPKHIIFGNFSALSSNLQFVLGINHSYRNSVSIYGFYAKHVLEFFATLGKKYTPPKITQKHLNNHRQVLIGNDVWIGCGVTIMGGVKIGSGAIIGTNSVVAKDIPPYAIAVGNPARIIKYRFDEETIKKFMAIRWWNWDVDKVFENAHLMDDPEKFLEKHYSPDLEEISENNLGGGAVLSSAERKIFILLLLICILLSRLGREKV